MVGHGFQKKIQKIPKQGLTQEQLAELAGTNKSYISKLERNLKDIRFSTLQRIINDGLGGHLDISIRLD
jgi:transcriptional regulator with XRE-family HTH domain